MSVIITNINIPKSCAQCNKIGLGFSVNCRKNIFGRSAEGKVARHKDCPLKSTDDNLIQALKAGMKHKMDINKEYSCSLYMSGLNDMQECVLDILKNYNNKENK